MSKTNVARLLKQSDVPFDLLSYTVDEEDLSAQNVARKINYPLSSIFKTLVLETDQKQHIFAVISGEEELDLKAVALALSTKKVQMVPMNDLMRLTGYIRGGVAPIGAKKTFPVLLSDRAVGQSYMIISAGKRGWQIKLAPDDFLTFTNGILFTNR
ncbi:Cys-tRNA(Pro) deacylase [Exiguobacterium antarcticum]|uniref:Cys-tRNA(Pro)/Cys-tRNA(Cys) deacylase n=1 Tax=Exiguobacterium antarcticum TaxID=132920 RepID=A0ABT6QZ65_9BACL|nr:Cys-tRNA(Pro) deacylase [Exiguobacterium antarcticum]MDI3233985.1 Cys-tRNA(Pro) deacylase [Exiguobacterium antarcticum]